METKPVDYFFKVALLGDSGIGKSQLLKRLIAESDSLSDTSGPTLGVDFKYKIFNLDFSGVRVRLKFFDTSGASAYRHICLSYLYCVQAYLIMYDVTSLASFTNCQNWLDEISKPKYKCLYDMEGTCGGGDDGLIKILVGCKNDSDLSNAAKKDTTKRCCHRSKVVPTKKAREFARKNGFVLFFETSAKSNTNVKELFDEICFELVANYLNYLNFKLAKLGLFINSSGLEKSMTFNCMSLPALSSKSDVYFDCKSEALNCGHIILNNLNARRKNLKSKSFFISDILNLL